MSTKTLSPRIGDAHRPLRDVVCDELRRQIIDGTRVSGARLIEDKVAEQLGVSRNPVREALRILEAEGFIEMIPRRGACVVTLSDQDLEDIFQVRSALEALSARLAAKRATPAQITKLDRVLKLSSKALKSNDIGRIALLNTQFHEGIVEMAGNGYLADLLSPLRGRVQKIFGATADARASYSIVEHRDVLRAIEDHDEDRAAELAAHHVEMARLAARASLAACQEGD